MSRARKDYETELTKLVLRVTQPEFGAFEFSEQDFKANFDRGRMALAQGDVINIVSSPISTDYFVANDHLIVIDIPIMKGLLGYRQLVVNGGNVSLYENVRSYSALKKFKPGQVSAWVDSKIYRENDLPLITGISFDVLFKMLALKRFDYLPLGISEIKKEMSQRRLQTKGMKIVPNIVLYYPFPVYFQVSAKYPKLAKRIKAGLMKIKANGEFDALYQHHFSEYIDFLKQKDIQVFFLRNPNLPMPLQDTPPTLVDEANVILSPALNR